MHGAFHGDVAGYYARYRRGFPPDVVETLATALALTPTDTVLDLGCGTGQLTLPLAAHIGRVVGVDPEPDMLHQARSAARAATVTNVDWVLGSADELDRIAARYSPVAAVTVANTIHLLDRPALFAAARTVLRPGRRLAVIAHGTPLWLQDSTWSRALRAFLERWSGLALSCHCGTDEQARARYRDELTAAGYTTAEVRIDYAEVLSVEQIVGGVFSAMAHRLPARAERARFAANLAHALAGTAPYLEPVPVRALIATVEPGTAPPGR